MYISVIKANVNVVWFQSIFLKLAADYIAATLTHFIIFH